MRTLSFVAPITLLFISLIASAARYEVYQAATLADGNREPHTVYLIGERDNTIRAWLPRIDYCRATILLMSREELAGGDDLLTY